MTTHPTRTRYAGLLAAFLISVTGAACSGVADSSATPANPPAAPAAPIAAPVKASGPALTLMQQITAEIGTAACDTSAQCKTLAVGSKACGGPERYIAYSTKHSDGAKLARLAADDSAAKKARDTSNGMVSTCSMVVDPGAACNAGRCVTSNASGAELPVR